MNQLAEALTLQHGGPGADALAFSFQGPLRLVAGSLDRWKLHVTARRALASGGQLAIAHRWPNDWGDPQCADPAAPDYLEIGASSGAALRWWNTHLPTWHPFDHVLFVELCEGLREGERLTLSFGEPRFACPGFTVQSFIEQGSTFSLRWRPSAASSWTEFAQHRFDVTGAEPLRMVATLPSRIGAQEAPSLHLRIEDRWGNPAALEAPVGFEVLEAREAPRVLVRGTIPITAFARVDLPPMQAGVQRVVVRGSGNRALDCESNPVEVALDAAVPRLYWGDLHGQSVIGCGARSIDAYFAHARDFAAADVASHQANCFLVSNDEWRETEASTMRHHEPQRFVTLLGVEWSASSVLGGDHNVYFPGDEAELHRCSHEFLADRSDLDTDLPHVQDLHRHYRGSDTLVAVHVGGRTANLEWYEPGLDRLLEVHSTHATSDWFLFEALRRGYRMGVTAGSDGVDGRPGNSHPGHMGVRNLRGGLTAILAPELTRASLWRALKARHCYATTGARIVVDFRLGDAIMGDEAEADAQTLATRGFAVRIAGTAPIESIEFFRGTDCLRQLDCFAAAGEPGNQLRVAWNGASAPGNWQRARMRWDGAIRVEGMHIAGVRDYAFDTPDEGVTGHDQQGLGFRSVTAGDWDGVILECDPSPRGELWFDSAPMKLRTRLDGLGNEPWRFEASEPRRCVELRRLPRTLPPREWQGSFVDPRPLDGTHAYWVRIRQADGAFAWTSPIFVTTGASGS